MIKMNLEETVIVTLHVVKEYSYREIADLYHTTTTGWKQEKPEYFGSKEAAEKYKNRRIENITERGYKECAPGRFYSSKADTNHNIEVSTLRVTKERIIPVGNKTYFFSKKNSKMYEIHGEVQ